MDLFKHLWAVDRIQRLGILRYFQPKIDECITYWTNEGFAGQEIQQYRTSMIQQWDLDFLGYMDTRFLQGREVRGGGGVEHHQVWILVGHSLLSYSCRSDIKVIREKKSMIWISVLFLFGSIAPAGTDM